MRLRHLSLEGFVRAEPAPAFTLLREAFDQAGGVIVQAQAYANTALSLAFEVTAHRLPDLARGLARAGLVLYEGSERALASCLPGDDPDEELSGHLMVTLVHHQPDKPGFTPPVPG